MRAQASLSAAGVGGNTMPRGEVSTSLTWPEMVDAIAASTPLLTLPFPPPPPRAALGVPHPRPHGAVTGEFAQRHVAARQATVGEHRKGVLVERRRAHHHA